VPLRTKKPSPKEGVFWERVISFYGGTELVIVSRVVAGCFFLKQDMTAMPAMAAPEIRARAVKKLRVTAMDLPPRQRLLPGGRMSILSDKRGMKKPSRLSEKYLIHPL